MAKPVPRLSAAEIASVIAIAWDDRPPFCAVLLAHGLGEGQVIALLKRELTPNAYKLWKARSGLGGATAGPRQPARKAAR